MATLKRGMRPVHPGELLAEIFEDQGIKVQPTAALLGISRQQLHRVLNGTAPVTPVLAVKIGKLMGNGPRLWINMQAAYDVAIAEKETAVENIPTIAEAAPI